MDETRLPKLAEKTTPDLKLAEKTTPDLNLTEKTTPDLNLPEVEEHAQVESLLERLMPTEIAEELATLTTGYTPDPGQEQKEPTYYDYPVLKAPVWTWEIPAYFFVGGAAGATFGNFAWSAWGWPGVCAVCLVLSGAALLLQFMAPKMD